eukprot:3686-Amphidinium_carterae.1
MVNETCSHVIHAQRAEFNISCLTPSLSFACLAEELPPGLLFKLPQWGCSMGWVEQNQTRPNQVAVTCRWFVQKPSFKTIANNRRSPFQALYSNIAVPPDAMHPCKDQC